MTAPPAGPALAWLAGKYHRMAALRRALPPAPAEGHDPALSPTQRAALLALARDFPGALRELDTLTTDEIDGRQAALEAAARGGTPEDWMLPLADYHRLMRTVLSRRLPEAARSGEAAAPPPLDPPPSDTFLAASSAPREGRLMAVTFDELARRYGRPAAELWELLFPVRRGPRPYRGAR